MLVLGIETSCDETGVALFDGCHGLLAERLYSQIELHQQYGGVVPGCYVLYLQRTTVPPNYEP